MKPNLAIPFVAGIIERRHSGKLQLLMQTRIHTHESIYNGTLEFAAGKLDVQYENIYDALAREIKEETGLTLTRIIDDLQTKVHTPQHNDAAFGFRPFFCTQQLREGFPWIGFIFRCEVAEGQLVDREGETKDVQWMDAADVKKIFDQTPEKLFTLEVPAWEHYFKTIKV